MVELKEIIRFQVFEWNEGHCWWCYKNLSWENYGIVGGRGAWEKDHSNPRSRGGSNNLKNLVPACLDCNRSKGKKRWR